MGLALTCLLFNSLRLWILFHFLQRALHDIKVKLFIAICSVCSPRCFFLLFPHRLLEDVLAAVSLVSEGIYITWKIKKAAVPGDYHVFDISYLSRAWCKLLWNYLPETHIIMNGRECCGLLVIPWCLAPEHFSQDPQFVSAALEIPFEQISQDLFCK